MNGPHDMGAMQCYGPVRPEPSEPVFHADWEKRVLALTVAMGATGTWGLDKFRHSRERIDPATYLASSYYQLWIAGLEKLLVESGLASAAEIAAGHMQDPAAVLRRVPDAGEMAEILSHGAPTERPVPSPAKFRVGERVRTRNLNPPGHTRLPRYARAKIGVVEAVAGGHVFPDANAHGKGEQPRWLYTVRFAGEELFGTGNAQEVCVDCWEPYLEPA